MVNRSKTLLLGVATLGFTVLGSAANAAPVFPSIGADSGPGFIIDVMNSGTTVTATGQGPYDGSDDTYVGIINNSSISLSSIHLTSGDLAFAFDSDGIDAYGAMGNLMDPTGYGGPNSYFTNISADLMSGTVNFITPLAANGGSTYFSLEEDLTAAGGGGGIGVGVSAVPLPASFPMFGGAILALGLVGYGMKRRSTKATAAAMTI